MRRVIEAKEITSVGTDFIYVRIGVTKKEWEKIKVSEEWKKILTGNVGEEKTLSENFAKNMAGIMFLQLEVQCYMIYFCMTGEVLKKNCI